MRENLDLWCEKYRPKTINDYVFKDANMKNQIQKWINDGKIDAHLLFSGTQGSGKTSLAKLLFRLLEVNPGDILELNASEERTLEVVREKIITFCSMWGIGDYRYILLDEADYLNHLTQPALRNVMEKYSAHARFILTCNHPNKIIPAIHSRCQEFKFSALDRTDYELRCATILAKEGIEFNLEVLDDYVRVTYPDMRKCINLLQQNSSTGTLLASKDASGNDDYLLKMVDLFKGGHITEARKLIVEQAVSEQYEDIYRFFYDNLDLWGDKESQQNEAIMAIAAGLRDHGMVADVEINLAATMVKLNNIKNG